jgi:copper(I)-binding protein
MRVLAAVLLLAAASAYSQSKGEIEVRQPWSRATPPGARVAAGFMEIRNNGAQPDRLVSASTGVAKRVEMHITQREGEIMKMRPVKAFEIPARERITLRPGGSHLMLVDVTRPLRKGERVAMTLRFERAGELEIELEVQELGSRHPRH